ncbi:VPLPA-CTERM sorting domain-containing protein [Pseudooceanicola onchidii]|uniref:VPLPA-CTERM sorting domain-containing protein n=1 Tax=Pseudooceanicola onchidii TaxID=2562279 RepID=UPI0010AA47A9|nr:VPLPA-CTERM sorting domain-containing protein [Pseudooceanicola onchidii]
MKLISLAFAALVAGTVAAQANTIRYTYDTEADQTRTAFYPVDITSGPNTGNSYYGTTGYVSGTLDIDTSGSADAILGYNLNTRLPHGYPEGSISPTSGNFVVNANLNLSFGDGSIATVSGATITLTKIFSFDTRFGPSSLITNYDPNDDTLYPFEMLLNLVRQTDGSYNVTRLQMTCKPDYFHGGACNSYSQSNFANWDSTSGAAVSGVLLSENQGQTPAVPLPAGGVLLITGLAALALRKRKA